MPKDPFTIHTVVPGFAAALCGGVTYSALRFYYNKAEINKELYWFPKFNLVLYGLTGFLGYYFTKMRLMKSFPIVSFATSGGAIGIKQIPGKRDINRPPMSIFYTSERTNSSMTSKEVNTRTSWLPNQGDLRFTEGMAMFVSEIMGYSPGGAKNFAYNLLCFLFRHWSHSEMEVVTNARPNIDKLVKQAPQMNDTDTPARIVILCHGMGGHQHIHSDLVMKHINALPGGAGVVICPTFTDGSSGFAIRDERDVNNGVLFKESKFTMSFKDAPQEKFIEWRAQMLESRVQQVEEILKFIANREERGSSGEGGGLAAYLFPQNAEAQNEFINKNTSIKADKLEVRLIGHSFGAATVLKTAVDHIDDTVNKESDRLMESNNSGENNFYFSHVHIQSVCALDTWMTPLTHGVVGALEEAANNNKNKNTAEGKSDEKKNDDKKDAEHPPLLLIDSHQWEKWPFNKQMTDRLMKVWKNEKCSRLVEEGTDHLTAMDMAAVIPKYFRRRNTKTKEDDSFRRKWATKCVFI